MFRGAYMMIATPTRQISADDVPPIGAELVHDHAPGETARDEDTAVGARMRPKLGTGWKVATNPYAPRR